MDNGVLGLTSWLRVLSAQSIEGGSGKVTRHRLTDHLSFHLLHGWGKYPLIGNKILVTCSQICYHRGENRWVGWVRLTIPPSHPRQGLTRLETHPTPTSIAVVPGEVTIHELTDHLTLLNSVPVGRAEGRRPVKKSSYGERDYAFGQLVLGLRTSIGLTQAGLARQLDISRQAVVGWEAGSSYPKASHLKALIALAVKEQVFPVGHEEEEIRALWKAAHQKVLLDETWLSVLLSQPPAPSAQGSVEQSGGAQVGSTPPPSQTSLALVSQPGQRPPPAGPGALRAEAFSGPLLDWGDALDVPSFFGREWELATLSEWVVQDHCRVGSGLGLGGIGNAALVVQAMRELASHFDVVLFRSLRDAPPPEALLSSCLAVLAPEAQDVLHESLERRLSRLLAELRSLRVLLVLDNLEGLREAREARGRPRAGSEGYGQVLEPGGLTGDQSCLLLSSREHPAALRALESRLALVRSLRLSGLSASACALLLGEHELV